MNTLIELRNGTTVEVPDPRERYQERMRANDRRGRWLFEFEDGVPVRARWYSRIDAETVDAYTEEMNA